MDGMRHGGGGPVKRAFDGQGVGATSTTRSWGTAAGSVACVLGLAAPATHGQDHVVETSARVIVNGDAIAESLTGVPGNVSRGRTIVASRQQGLCLLCHTGPFPEERFQGNLAPDLAGAGSRWSEAQLRLRVVDARRLNSSTIMPPYHRIDGLSRVGTAWRSRPVLTAQQVEDVVAFLATLRE